VSLISGAAPVYPNGAIGRIETVITGETPGSNDLTDFVIIDSIG
jgi:hypothetical protein